MASKYSVSYIYQIIDKFSNPMHKIKRSMDRANVAAEKTRRKFEKMGKSMGDAAKKASIAVGIPMVLMARSMIKAASDAEETRSKYATVFKSMGKEAENVADSFAANFGLAGTKARQLLSDTGDMLTGFGFAQKEALKLSLQVNELAVDLASFTNYSGGAEGASQALTKALLGERESIKSLGIAILEEDVKKKVQVMRSKGMRFATMREAKAYATLQLAIEQSGNAIGDYARTKNSYANTLRRVQGRIQDLAESYGNLLLPVATKVLNIIEKGAIYFTNLSEEKKKLILIVAGVTMAAIALLAVLTAIAAILPVLAAGWSLFVSSLPIVALAAVFGLAVKLGGILVELAFVVGGLLKNKFAEGFNAAKEIVQKFYGFFLGIFSKITDKINAIGNAFSSIKNKIPFLKDDEMKVAGSLAVEAAMMKNQLAIDTNINVSAEKGTTATATTSINSGKLGNNVGMVGAR